MQTTAMEAKKLLADENKKQRVKQIIPPGCHM